jgi:hypothetical protein
MEVGGPVGGFTSREVTEVETFHGIEEDASAWRNEPRAQQNNVFSPMPIM